MTHELKTWAVYFNAVLAGDKTFEVRREDDRTFAVGDVLHLRETDPAWMRYTGREARYVVTYVLRGAPFLPNGVAVLGIRPEAAA